MGSNEGINGPGKRRQGAHRQLRSGKTPDQSQDVALSASGEHIYVPDVGTEPAHRDIDHLCRVWAEVARSILARRQQTNEQEELT